MRICCFVIVVLLFSASIISCQKEIDPYTPPGGSDSTNVPVDTTVTDTSSSGAYHPTSVGSTWTYKDSASGETTIATIGDSTKKINGILFKEYLSTSNAQTVTSWIASPSPNYYISAEGTSPGTSAPFNLTFYYLNDASPVGSHWDYTAGSGNGFTAYTTTTVVAKGLTLTVEGKTYKNVIQTHLDLSYNLFGTVSNYGGYDYFMAEGVGFIKIRATVSLGGVPVTQTCTNLVDYKIK